MKRTTIRLVVLSEGPIPKTLDIAGIVEECDVGDYVLAEVRRKEEDLTDEQMAEALLEAGSDPSFFLLESF